jgi:DNA-binding transcriptional ArsR family regulator
VSATSAPRDNRVHRAAGDGRIDSMSDRLQSVQCARWLKALADPERLRIVECLQRGPKTVSDLAEALEAELPNVSHHLGVLRHAGLVQDQRQGKFVEYRLHPDVFRPGRTGGADALDLGCCRLQLGP